MRIPLRTDYSAEIILVCNSLDAGGIERVVSTLANEWCRKGRRICVVNLHNRHPFYTLDPGVHHVIIDHAGLTRIADIPKWFIARIGKLNLHRLRLVRLLGKYVGLPVWKQLSLIYDSVLFTYESFSLRRALMRLESPVIVALGTPINVITIRACRGMERRVIISERNDPKRLPRIRNWDALARRFYNHADVVTANTRSALRDMNEFVASEKLVFVPNPLRISGIKGNGTPSPSPLILIVARLVPDKAHDVVLNAFALVRDELKEWRLAIVGDGKLRKQLFAQAEALGISQHVDWHGVVDDPHHFYRSARIFALPSRVEGTPNALLEAMNHGLPVVVSDGAPGPMELVSDEETGLVVGVNDVPALAAALVRLANDEPLRLRLGEAARARVTEYDLPRAIATWETVVGLTP